MKKLIQTFVAVPISESIGRAFGGNTLIGTGAALLTARIVMRSFPGMIALGALAGGLNYVQSKKIIDADQKAKAMGKLVRPA